jgi:hypothetical protein
MDARFQSLSRVVKEALLPIEFDICSLVSYQWYYHNMTTATAQAAPNIAFIKFALAKLDGTNRKARYGKISNYLRFPQSAVAIAC